MNVTKKRQRKTNKQMQIEKPKKEIKIDVTYRKTDLDRFTEKDRETSEKIQTKKDIKTNANRQTKDK